MSEPFLGEIKIVGFNFAPRGFAGCDGQLLSIAQNSALFALFGTYYGGDGRTTFGLPELRGRVPMHYGNGPGLSSRSIGQRSGTETNTLSTGQLPNHTHPANVMASTGEGDRSDPAAAFPARVEDPVRPYAGTGTTAMAGGSVQVGGTGSGQAVNNLQPYTVLNFVVALTGIFPSRN